MYRSDKQFMKNPATASSRIYIGNIAEGALAPDLEEKFKVHGKILGLVLQRGFAFIQYEMDSQAQAAIRAEHGCAFFARKLNVRQAVDKSRSNAPQSQQPFVPPSAPQLTPTHSAGPPPSLMQKHYSPPRQFGNVDQMDTAPVMNEDNVNANLGDKDLLNDQDFQNRPIHPNLNDTRQRGMAARRGAMGGRNFRENRSDYDKFPQEEFNPLPRDQPIRDIPQRDAPPYFGREEGYRPGFVPPPVIERPERNDCEIIVVSKLLTEYAEYIEKRLKGIGLMVDLLYPNEDVPLGRVLANISSRGCLYAILIMPQNEDYRSLTLSILHGIPQEHRNMPIEDAITLITRNFDLYMRGGKVESKGPGASTASLTDRHSEPIQMLLNLLAENRQITTAQYDRLIKYLQDRRELQKQFEIAEGNAEKSTDVQPNSKQAELQSRIMNILNKPNEDAPKPFEKPPPPHQSAGPTPLLKDPSVQKALDSLMLDDMFKTISSNF